MSKKMLGSDSLISKRSEQAKKDIEKLNAELQQLIEASRNKHKTEATKPLEIAQSTIQINASQKNITHDRKTIPKTDLHPHILTTKDKLVKTLEKSPNDKAKAYNVDEAREFMRKQKEKRLNQFKSDVKTSELNVQDRKLKLKELQQKSLLIVNNNVKRSRSRSKSRDKDSTEDVPPEKQKILHQSRKCTNPDVFRIKPDVISNLPSTSAFHGSTSSKESLQVVIHPNVTLRKKSPKLNSRDELTTPKIVLSEAKDLNKAATKIQATFKGYKQRKLFKNLLQLTQITKDEEHAITSDNSGTKKLQIVTERPIIDNNDKEFDIQPAVRFVDSEVEFKEAPRWLQSKMNHPYNFISAVKKKLAFAASQPNPQVKVDIGTQSNENFEKIQSKEEIKELLQNSIKSTRQKDLKSFLSHKCLNLDLKKVEELNLISRKSKLQTDFDGDTSKHAQSDSDTSKNIPDLSSENTSVQTDTTAKGSNDSSYSLNINSKGLKHLRLMTDKRRLPLNDTFEPIITSNEKVSVGKLPSSVIEVFQRPEKVNSKSNPIENIRSKSAKDSISSRNSKTEHSSVESDVNTLKSLENGLAKLETPMVERNLFASNKISDMLMLTKIEDGLDVSDIPQSPVEVSKSIENSENALSLINSNKTDSYTKLNVQNYSDNRSRMREISTNRDISESRNTTKLELGSKHKPVENYNVKEYSSNRSETDSSITTEDKYSKYSKQRDSTASSRRAAKKLFPLDDEAYLNRNKSKGIPLKSNSNNADVNEQFSIKSKMEERQNSSNYLNRGFIQLHKNQNVADTLNSNALSNVDTDSISDSIFSDIFESDAVTEEHNILSSTAQNGQAIDSQSAPKTVRMQVGETVTTTASTNQINVKFQAELHLLNDFNQTLYNLLGVEKTFNNLGQTPNPKTVTQNQNTQTSFVTSNKSSPHIISSVKNSVNTETDHSNILNSSVIASEFSFLNGSILEKLSTKDDSDIQLSKIGEMSKVGDSSLLGLGSGDNKTLRSSIQLPLTQQGISFQIFDQLIKDEDARIDNLKTILKIRESALLDRTQVELAWLEIQKKHLKETGKLNEASIVKKKQRGILIKLQHEKHEMQRLKQVQKAASKERKHDLKQQQNLIKAQLTSNDATTVAKIKKNHHMDRRSSEPLKVLQHRHHLDRHHSTRSDTSVTSRASRRSSSIAEEVFVTTSYHSDSVRAAASDDANSASISVRETSSTTRTITASVATTVHSVTDRDGTCGDRKTGSVRNGSASEQERVGSSVEDGTGDERRSEGSDVEGGVLGIERQREDRFSVGGGRGTERQRDKRLSVEDRISIGQREERLRVEGGTTGNERNRDRGSARNGGGSERFEFERVFRNERFRGEDRKDGVEIIGQRGDVGRIAVGDVVDEAAVAVDLAVVERQNAINKRLLHMKEDALQKRRKEAEELLQWHQRLLEEEKKVADLEMAATSVINHQPMQPQQDTTFKPLQQPQMNLLWTEMTKADIEPHPQDIQDVLKTDSGNTNHMQSDNFNLQSDNFNVQSDNFNVQSDSDNTISDKISSRSYSYDFDPGETTDRFDEDAASLVTVKSSDVEDPGVLKSQSTLNEIMHNISMISEEISEIYRISSSGTNVPIKGDLSTIGSAKDSESNNEKQSVKVQTNKTIEDNSKVSLEPDLLVVKDKRDELLIDFDTSISMPSQLHEGVEDLPVKSAEIKTQSLIDLSLVEVDQSHHSSVGSLKEGGNSTTLSNNVISEEVCDVNSELKELLESASVVTAKTVDSLETLNPEDAQSSTSHHESELHCNIVLGSLQDSEVSTIKSDGYTSVKSVGFEELAEDKVEENSSESIHPEDEILSQNEAIDKSEISSTSSKIQEVISEKVAEKVEVSSSSSPNVEVLSVNQENVDSNCDDVFSHKEENIGKSEVSSSRSNIEEISNQQLKGRLRSEVSSTSSVIPDNLSEIEEEFNHLKSYPSSTKIDYSLNEIDANQNENVDSSRSSIIESAPDEDQEDLQNLSVIIVNSTNVKESTSHIENMSPKSQEVKNVIDRAQEFQEKSEDCTLKDSEIHEILSLHSEESNEESDIVLSKTLDSNLFNLNIDSVGLSKNLTERSEIANRKTPDIIESTSKTENISSNILDFEPPSQSNKDCEIGHTRSSDFLENYTDLNTTETLTKTAEVLEKLIEDKKDSKQISELALRSSEILENLSHNHKHLDETKSRSSELKEFSSDVKNDDTENENLVVHSQLSEKLTELKITDNYSSDNEVEQDSSSTKLIEIKIKYKSEQQLVSDFTKSSPEKNSIKDLSFKEIPQEEDNSSNVSNSMEKVSSAPSLSYGNIDKEINEEQIDLESDKQETFDDLSSSIQSTNIEELLDNLTKLDEEKNVVGNEENRKTDLESHLLEEIADEENKFKGVQIEIVELDSREIKSKEVNEVTKEEVQEEQEALVQIEESVEELHQIEPSKGVEVIPRIDITEVNETIEETVEFHSYEVSEDISENITIEDPSETGMAIANDDIMDTVRKCTRNLQSQNALSTQVNKESGALAKPEEHLDLDSTYIVHKSDIATPNSSQEDEFLNSSSSFEEDISSTKEITPDILGLVQPTQESNSSNGNDVSDLLLRSSLSSKADGVLNVKKRVSEILADAKHRSDKSTRIQDLYTTTYDVGFTEKASEIVSELDQIDPEYISPKFVEVKAEELEILKKQLAIEQEIKQLEEQQQREQLPYQYLREIPNKPPPPYTPPITQLSLVTIPSVIPTSTSQITVVLPTISDHLYDCYVTKTLDTASQPTMTENTPEINELLFDLCKELAQEHYGQFKVTGDSCWTPSWLRLEESIGALRKPLDKDGLYKMLEDKLNDLYGFKEKVPVKESNVMKWSRKKRDHVDDVLVLELQADECNWTNFEEDELIVKDTLVQDLVDLLLKETLCEVKLIYEILGNFDEKRSNDARKRET